MKRIVVILVGLILASCNHVSPKPDAVASNIAQPVEYYGFKVVSREVPQKRTVSSSKKSSGTPVSEKYLMVSTCADAQGCESADKNAFIPYDRFIAQVKEEIKSNDKLMDKQEQYLESNLAFLKNEQNVMLQEHSYYERQLKLYKWSSLKPVVDGHKKAQEVVARDIKLFNTKILKIEDELRFFKRKNGVRLSQDESVNILMDLMASGQYVPVDEKSADKDEVWKLFQKMGKHFMYNPGV